MRATLLLVSSVVLIWFLWHSLDKGDDVSAQETVPGTLMAPEDAGNANSAPPANGLVPGGGVAAATTPSAERTESAAPAAAPAPASDTRARASDTSAPPRAEVPQAPANPAKASVAVPVPVGERAGTTSTSELELARSLVSDPAGYLARLEASSTPTGARRTWARALGQALAGETAAARDALERLATEPDVKSGERECLARLLDRSVVGVTTASAVAESALTRAAYLVAEARIAEELRSARKHREAAGHYSEILLGYVGAPWSSDPAVLRGWTEALTECQRSHRWSRTGTWPSIDVQVKAGDNLIAIRKRFVDEHKDALLCTGQIQAANELRSSTLQPGQTLRIPTDRAHMLVDLDAHWAFYLLGDEVAAAWEVGVGKPGSETQVGTFLVGDKQEQPMWFRPGHEPVPYGDPQNALGTRWIRWLTPDGQNTGLGFHGTNEPDSIGRDASLGCIRMRNPDVERLFEILPKGAAIRVQP